MKQQIKRLEEPGLKCCQLVYDELIRILGQLLGKIVQNIQTAQTSIYEINSLDIFKKYVLCGNWADSQTQREFSLKNEPNSVP